MGNENDGIDPKDTSSYSHILDASRKLQDDRDQWLLETRDSKLTDPERRRKAFLIYRGNAPDYITEDKP